MRKLFKKIMINIILIALFVFITAGASTCTGGTAMSGTAAEIAV